PQRLADLVAVGIPEPGDSLSSIRDPRLGYQGLAVRAEGCRQEQTVVRQMWTARLTRGGRPKLCRFTPRANHPDQHFAAIGTKGCCPDRAFKLSVPNKFTTGHVPQPSGVQSRILRASGQDGFAIGTEGHGEDVDGLRQWVSDWLADWFAGCGVPGPGGAVRTSSQEGFSVGREGHLPNRRVVPQDRP